MDSERSARYPNVLRAVAETPWAILPTTLATILEIVSLRAKGQRFSDEQIQERIGTEAAARRGSGAYVSGTVAVIPLNGVIVPRATLYTQISGGTSLDDFTASLRDAVADDQISAILVDVNSPGGSTDGMPEAAAIMRELRGTKPIAAIANYTCASAAMWLASQCDEISATPSAMYGSQGVIAAHEDISGALEKEGINTTLVTSGRYKAEFTSLKPLSDEDRARLQTLVDDMNGMFVADVAKGRGVTAKTVRDGYGQGRMFTAREALDAGMIDRIETFEQAFARLAKGAGKTSKPGRKATDDVLDLEALAAVTATSASPTLEISFDLDGNAEENEPADKREAEAPPASSDELEAWELRLALDEQTH